MGKIKGKQLAMDSLLREADWNEKQRKKREWAIEKEKTDAIVQSLDDKYGRINDERKFKEMPAGTVVIIGQNVFRNEHYTRHFYRTVMSFHDTRTEVHKPVFVQAENEEWPDIPPWADTVGHEGEPKDMSFYMDHLHWVTGEIVEPIKTWWMKRWGI